MPHLFGKRIGKIKLEIKMKYELIVKHPSVVHIFNDDQKDHYIEIAKRLNGKIRDRKTKKVIYIYCKEEQ